MSYLSDWAPAPQSFAIAPGEIHVWRANLNSSQPALQSLEASLAPDEITRADRFYFQRDRDNFVAARGILRQLLGKYLARAPQDILFAYHERGKPFLHPHPLEPPIRFNISHSHQLALFSFSLARDVGVDVEFVRPNISTEEIAVRYFAPQEIADLQSLPPAERPEGFFQCWTRKEAYVKARGDGLQIPLTSFCVSLAPSAPVTLASEDSSRWKLHSLSVQPAYAGALVGEGQDWRPVLYDWQPLP